VGLRRHQAPLARDEALRRLRRLTVLAAAAGTALAGAFAALAASAVPGRKVGSPATPQPISATSGGVLRVRTPKVHPVAARVQSGDDAPAPASAPAPPPAAPAPAPAPAPPQPVVVSGGS
jgi:hypothetical protein